MAAVTANLWDHTSMWSAGTQYAPQVRSYEPTLSIYQTMTEGPVRRIKMRWLDVDALPTIIYRIWVVTDQPDPTGVFYTGTKSGSTPITGATVEEDYVS